MGQPRTVETIGRELKRLRVLRADRRKYGSRENYQTLIGAEWALQWAVGAVHARAVSRAIKDAAKGGA